MQEEKPKILLVAFEVIPSPTGASATIGDLLRGLTPVFEVDVLSAHAPGMPHVQKYFGARVFRVPVGKGTFLSRAEKFRRAVIRQLDSDQYDLVHCFSLWGAHPVLEEFGRHDYKTVLHVETLESLDLKYHYPELRHDRRLSRTIQARESMALELSDRVVVPTQTAAQFLAAQGLDSERVSVVPPGVDVTLFHPDPEPSRTEPLTVVYAGSMAPWQGLSTAIYAFGQLRRQQQVRLVVISPTVRRWADPLCEIADQERVTDIVEFHEPVPREQLPSLLRRADLAIAPLTRTDRNMQLGCSPLRLFEYLACGLPVVASRLPSVEEVIEDGELGLLAVPGDPQSLVQQVTRLLEDEALRGRLSEAGSSRAIARHGIGQFWKGWLRIYAQLLEIPVPRLALPDEEIEVVPVEAVAEEVAGDEIREPFEAAARGADAPLGGTPATGSGPSAIGELVEEAEGSGMLEGLFNEDEEQALNAAFEGGAAAGPAAPAETPADPPADEAPSRERRLRGRYYAREGLLDSLLDSKSEEDEEE